jgi:hypothetical protein
MLHAHFMYDSTIPNKGKYLLKRNAILTSAMVATYSSLRLYMILTMSFTLQASENV